MWFRYQLRYRPKVSTNLGFGFGIGPKPKQWFWSYTKLLSPQFIPYKMSTQGGRWSKKAKILSMQFVNDPKKVFEDCTKTKTVSEILPLLKLVWRKNLSPGIASRSVYLQAFNLYICRCRTLYRRVKLANLMQNAPSFQWPLFVKYV